nr:hypothetical protein [Orientia tsutsugamushi]
MIVPISYVIAIFNLFNAFCISDLLSPRRLALSYCDESLCSYAE